jgi:hypothetical protein
VLLIDVNVFVYAHRQDAEDHSKYKAWLDRVVAADVAFGLSELVLSGFVRIVTHPSIYRDPTPLATALAFVNGIRDRDNCVLVQPGPRHWDIFCRLLLGTRGRGNLVPDAYLAALAIESGSEWITTDGDYARFPGLNYRHPLH